jgi:purine-nucleoside phosphorylase
MQAYQAKIAEAADFLRPRASGAEIGIVAGTGLGECIGDMEPEAVVSYDEIPHFPVSTVTSHYGRLAAGSLCGRGVVCLQGRFHLYEGYTPLEVTFPVRVLQAMGVKTLILVNAAGGLNLQFSPGDIMLILDHINLTGENPLIGPNIEAWGMRFPDMTAVYDKELMEIAGRGASTGGISLKQGVYAGLKGPSLETPAETRFLRNIGSDAVGLSTVMEAIVGVHAGMRILGLSTITNINDPDRPEPATVEAIIEVAAQAAPRLGRIIEAVAGGTRDHG